MTLPHTLWIATIDTITSTAYVAIWAILVTTVTISKLVHYYRTRPTHDTTNRRRAILGCIAAAGVAALWITLNLPAKFISVFDPDDNYSQVPVIVLLGAIAVAMAVPALLARQLTDSITGRYNYATSAQQSSHTQTAGHDDAAINRRR
ncbi:hypothetical protein CH275_26690 [Rhodococcus sp. 06-235-1A]|uniref:hypothetical protein n=1 Tax=Rhodococcus sp. 06-235-1A TaxID=2022508 RepID=UPI000B9AEBE7|nr:hypothetical protein [Rhodococcus sp. 06-235-1A]OZC96130.1 hypothetical protein CH275_26690 [Rhodococcus sp. 06-235-1A]